ncbi:hypothetical protein [Marinobacter sp. ELB17]|uniref:secretion/conjugation apparatus DotM-related subunit n=1 Tax=Marinobacter sp. ELB17 TaxID=270374 RepID=UPI0000F3B395|nr:hypothetical protein [Marinobacter sp. ELB17]EAZ98365.1 hypothetical protein MELB17_09068 [Marinobacter sp. ELB17]
MAMNPQKGGGQGGSDPQMDSMIFGVVIIGTIYLMCWLLWKSNNEIILSTLFQVVGFMSKGLQYVPWIFPDKYADNFGNWAVSLQVAIPGNYGWPAAKQMIGVITHTLSLVFVPLIILRVKLLRRTHITNKFVRYFNLDKLKAINASRYAAVASVQHENLLKIPVHEGPLATARSPIDYALENKLVVVQSNAVGSGALRAMFGMKANSKKESKPKPITGWTSKKMRWSVAERRRVMPNPNQCRLDTVKTDALLAQQLGGLFNIDSLDRFERCVLAILLTANTSGLGPARELALPLAMSYKRLDAKGRHNPVINDKGVDGIIKKLINKPKIRDITRKHAFKSTVFMALLESSWKKGVFIAAEFLWLKGVNRGLYIALDALGGDRPFVEGLGTWGHYMLEVQQKKAVKTPCVEAGTDALQVMLFDEEWIGSEDGLASEIAARKAIDGGQDDEYSPTKGIDLFTPPPRP